MKCYMIYNKTQGTYLSPIEGHWKDAPQWISPKHMKYCIFMNRDEAEKAFERTKNYEIRGLTLQFREVEVPAEEAAELLLEQAEALASYKKMSYEKVEEDEEE